MNIYTPAQFNPFLMQFSTLPPVPFFNHCLSIFSAAATFLHNIYPYVDEITILLKYNLFKVALPSLEMCFQMVFRVKDILQADLTPVPTKRTVHRKMTIMI